jgi:hypothetical protein
LTSFSCCVSAQHKHQKLVQQSPHVLPLMLYRLRISSRLTMLYLVPSVSTPSRPHPISGQNLQAAKAGECVDCAKDAALPALGLGVQSSGRLAKYYAALIVL